MSLTTTIFLLICGWLAVAGAMLWGCCGSPAGITTLSHRQPRQKSANRRHVPRSRTESSTRQKKPPAFFRRQAAKCHAINQASSSRFCRARRASMFRLSIAAENAIAAYT